MKNSLNLMTDEAQRTVLFREAKRLWSRMLGGTLLGLSLLGLLEWWQGSTATRHLKWLETQYAPVQSLKDECITMETQMNMLSEAQQLTLRLVDTQPTATLLGAISAAAAETSGQVYLEKLELKQPGPDRVGRMATLEGAGQSNAAIADFATALRNSELFEEVTLNSSISSKGHTEPARSFRLECKL